MWCAFHLLIKEEIIYFKIRRKGKNIIFKFLTVETRYTNKISTKVFLIISIESIINILLKKICINFFKKDRI